MVEQVTNKARERWTVLEDETVFDASPYLTVSKQRLLTGQGLEVADYYQVHMPDYSACCPVTTDGQVVTLWQYKHGALTFGLTFPAGNLAGGESPESAMRRELLEETGYRAGPSHFLGRYAVSGNQGCGWASFYLMEGCELAGAPESGDLESMEIRLMAPDDVDDAVAHGAITVMPHVTLWGLARPYIPGLGAK